MAPDDKLNPADERSISMISPHFASGGRTRSLDCTLTSSSLVRDKNEERPCKSSFLFSDRTFDRRMQHVPTPIELE